MPQHIPAVGTKAQVWHGNALHTSGGVYKSGLFQDDNGNIKSKAKRQAALKNKAFMAARAPPFTKGSHARKHRSASPRRKLCSKRAKSPHRKHRSA